MDRHSQKYPMKKKSKMKIQYQDRHLTVFESALYRTTTSVLNLGTAWFLVDPNWLPQEINFIRDYIYNQDNRRDIYLLFTHSDFDHILGYGAFPEAVTIAHRNFVDHPFHNKTVQDILDFDDSLYISRPYDIKYPEIDIVIDKEGQTLKLGNQDIVFYSARGHIRDGMMACLIESQICIAGDYLSNIEIPWVEYSFKEYYLTLRRFEENIRNYHICGLIPGHGDYTSSVKNIEERLAWDMQYISEFLKGAIPDDQFVESIISVKGFPRQNQNIHDKNLTFRQSGDVFS